MTDTAENLMSKAIYFSMTSTIEPTLVAWQPKDLQILIDRQLNGIRAGEDLRNGTITIGHFELLASVL